MVLVNIIPEMSLRLILLLVLVIGNLWHQYEDVQKYL
jgi:hypothetical protein